MTKDEILAEIKRAAHENGGKAPGRQRFEAITGIKPYEWGRFWARYSDAVEDAGFEPNQLQAAHANELLLDKFLALTIELGHVPTYNELRLKRHHDPSYPSHQTFGRLGTKSQRVRKLIAYAESKDASPDLIDKLRASLVDETDDQVQLAKSSKYGFVYLAKGHPGEYKIGFTNLTDRRVSELGATFPVELQLVHEIKTDDPAGVEAYWHARFADKRMKGEWFKLQAADVDAFRRWRKII